MPFVCNLKALYSNDFPRTWHYDVFHIGAILQMTNLNGAFNAPKRAS